MSSSPQKNVREPSETEAWKLMMDSMIKFISASTKLMNTITARMETTPAPVKNSQEGECEAECVECPTRSAQECRECSAAMLLNGQKCEQPRNSSDAKGSPPSVDVAAVGTGEQRTEEGEKEPKDVGVAAPEPLTAEIEKPSESSEKICVCNELKQIKAFVKSGENVEQKREFYY